MRNPQYSSKNDGKPDVEIIPLISVRYVITRLFPTGVTSHIFVPTFYPWLVIDEGEQTGGRMYWRSGPNSQDACQGKGDNSC